MRSQLIHDLIVLAIGITVALLLRFVFKQPIPDHSAKFLEWQMRDAEVRNSEKKMIFKLDSLYGHFQSQQRKIDSLETIANASGKSYLELKKQLAWIKANTKVTNYQDSSKAAILNILPK